jgi:glucose-6-phosphate isomerase
MMTGHSDANPHLQVAGEHATTTIVLGQINAFTLGSLLAIYEHKVFCQGLIWDINSFDQYGVELGKRLAGPIFDQLGGESALGQDASTRGLIESIRKTQR